MAHETVIRSSLLVRDVQNPNTATQKFAVFTGSGNNDLNLLGFRTPTELLSDIGFNEAVDDRVSTLIQAGANISVTYDDDGNALIIAAPNTVTGSGTATQIAFWKSGSTTELTSSSNLYWDNVNGRLGVGINTPSARYHQSQTQGIFARYDITNPNADQNRGVWEFYTNTAVTPDFFGRFGFKFEGGVNNAAKHFQLHVNDATNPRLIINGNGNVGISTITPNARLQVHGADTTDTGWTAQFHNSLGNSNSLMIRNDGNVGIGTSGTTARLVVRGSGSSAASNALIVQNSGGTSSFVVQDDGIVRFNTARVISGFMTLQTNGGSNLTGFSFTSVNPFTATSDITSYISGNPRYWPVSGTGTFTYLNVNPSIDQTGGANGITRGIYIQPSLLSAPNWRSIEWNNDSGFGLYGAGSGTNYLNGNLGIKTTTPAQTLHVAGTMRLTGNAGTATEALGRDANGDLSGVPFSTIVASGGGVSGSGTSGQVTFWTGTNSQGGDNGLFWDNTSKRLGVGTASPGYRFHVAGSSSRFENSSGSFELDIVGGGTTSRISTTATGMSLGTLSNNAIVFWMSATERMRINSSTGHVGINQTAPAARLHVVGSSTGTTAWTAQFHNSGGTSNSLMIRDDGNVAIGNNSPNARLQVQGADTSNSNWTAQFHNSLGNSNSLMIRNDGNVGIGTSGTTARFVVRASGSSTGSTAMLVENSGGTSMLMVREDGNVGIGLNNPAYKLDVLGRAVRLGESFTPSGTRTNNTDKIGELIAPSYSGLKDVIIYQTYNSLTSNSFRFGGGTSIYDSPTEIRFFTATAVNTVGLERMRITSSGTVGIGTITPAQNLDVAGTMRLTGSTGTGTTLMARNADGDVSAVTVGSGLNLSNNTLTATGGGSGTVSGSGTATQVAFWGGTTGSTSTALSGSSNLYWDGINNRLGVGTSTPVARLQVHGADTTDTGWTAQFHNSLGNSNSLMIRNDGNVGVGTSGTTARFVVRASGSSTGSTAMLIQNSGGTAMLTVRENGNVGIGLDTPSNLLEIRGTTANNTASSFRVRNSTPTTLFEVRNDGVVFIGPSNLWYPYNDATGVATPIPNGKLMRVSYGASGPTENGYGLFISNAQITNRDYTTGEGGGMRLGEGYTPASGNGTYNVLVMTPTINQMGGASGITRGLFINPTITGTTAAADWRSIQWQNSVGYGLYGLGNAPNYLAGNLSIGTLGMSAKLVIRASGSSSGSTTMLVENSGGTSMMMVRDDGNVGIGTDAPAQTLHVAGTMRLTGSTGTGTTLMARNASGDVSAVTLGTGVVLSNNVISVALSPKAETPSGLVNGSNITYTLASTPIANQSVMVFLNGVAQYNGIDYTVSGTTITFGTAPANGSSIFAYYMA